MEGQRTAYIIDLFGIINMFGYLISVVQSPIFTIQVVHFHTLLSIVYALCTFMTNDQLFDGTKGKYLPYNYHWRREWIREGRLSEPIITCMIAKLREDYSSVAPHQVGASAPESFCAQILRPAFTDISGTFSLWTTSRKPFQGLSQAHPEAMALWL